MPTVLRIGALRIFFHANDRLEPPHVHVELRGASAKLWLDPVRLERSRGFSSHELRRVRGIVEDNRDHILRVWHDFFEE